MKRIYFPLCLFLITIITFLLPLGYGLSQTHNIRSSYKPQSKAIPEIWTDRVYVVIPSIDCQPSEYRTFHYSDLYPTEAFIYALLSPNRIIEGSFWNIYAGTYIQMSYSDSGGGTAIILRYSLPSSEDYDWWIKAVRIYWKNSATKNVTFSIYYNVSNIASISSLNDLIWRNWYPSPKCINDTVATGWRQYDLRYGYGYVRREFDYLWIKITLNDTEPSNAGTTYTARIGLAPLVDPNEPLQYTYDAGGLNQYSSAEIAVEVLIAKDDRAPPEDIMQWTTFGFASDEQRLFTYWEINKSIPWNESLWQGFVLKFLFHDTISDEELSHNDTGVMVIKNKNWAGASWFDIYYNETEGWIPDPSWPNNDVTYKFVTSNNTNYFEFKIDFKASEIEDMQAEIENPPVGFEVVLLHFYKTDTPYYMYRIYTYPAESKDVYDFDYKPLFWMRLYIAPEDTNPPFFYSDPLLKNAESVTFYEGTELVGAAYVHPPDFPPQVLIYVREPLNESGIKEVDLFYYLGFERGVPQRGTVDKLANESWEYTTYLGTMFGSEQTKGFEEGEYVSYYMEATDYNNQKSTQDNNGNFYSFIVGYPDNLKYYEVTGPRSLNLSYIGFDERIVTNVESYVDTSYNTSWILVISKATLMRPSIEDLIHAVGYEGQRGSILASFTAHANTSEITLRMRVYVDMIYLERHFYNLDTFRVYARAFYSTDWQIYPFYTLNLDEGYIQLEAQGPMRLHFVIAIFNERDPIEEVAALSLGGILALFGIIFIIKKITKREKHWNWGLVRYGTPM